MFTLLTQTIMYIEWNPKGNVGISITELPVSKENVTAEFPREALVKP